MGTVGGLAGASRALAGASQAFGSTWAEAWPDRGKSRARLEVELLGITHKF